VGGSMIFDSQKERYFLEVEKKNGKSRLVFGRHAQRTDIEDFCDKVRSVYKHQVT
jgi:hypothetical protein